MSTSCRYYRRIYINSYYFVNQQQLSHFYFCVIFWRCRLILTSVLLLGLQSEIISSHIENKSYHLALSLTALLRTNHVNCEHVQCCENSYFVSLIISQSEKYHCHTLIILVISYTYNLHILAYHIVSVLASKSTLRMSMRVVLHCGRLSIVPVF